jgi:hypothetical protein
MKMTRFRSRKRGGKTVRYPVRGKHLYKNGAKYREKKKFEREYGPKKGDYVYGATVGKVRREREELRNKKGVD